MCRYLNFAENTGWFERQDIAQQCPRGGNASFYKWRAKFGGMDASTMSEMSMQNDLLKEVLGKK